jgi:two-component system response regulator AtoC
MPRRVLIVDDDTDIREALADALEDSGYAPTACSSAMEALRVLEEETFDVVVTDVRMPAIDGIDLCGRIAANHGIPVIVMTAFGEMSAAVDALRAAAVDFITKPFEFEQLALAIERAISSSSASSIQVLEAPTASLDFSRIIGESPTTKQLIERLARIARTDASVLVTGESGTGKELIARALHENSRRAGGPFVAISCAAIPAQLLESELFGHEKGAFTGATGAHRGLFLRANGGTLFLDEIGAMPVDLQPALLRALQERVVRAVGGVREEPFDVRVIAATNQDLEKGVVEGTFRAALLFRLNVLQVEAPPVRDRGEDVIALALHFLARHAERQGGPPHILSDQTKQLLRTHSWPGNVRELENCMEAAATLARDGIIEPEDLPHEIRERADLTEFSPAPDASLGKLQREQIETVLRAVGGNKAEAARVLGIDRVTLYRRIKRFAGPRSAR